MSAREEEYVELGRRDVESVVTRPGYRITLVAKARELLSIRATGDETEPVPEGGIVIKNPDETTEYIFVDKELTISVRTLNRWPNALKGTGLAVATSGQLAWIFSRMLVMEDRYQFLQWYETSEADDRKLYEILDEICRGLCEGHPLSDYAPSLGSSLEAVTVGRVGSGDSTANTDSPPES